MFAEKVMERMRACRCHDYGDYLRRLHSAMKGVQERKRLLELLINGETSFFRNEPQFNALRLRILPRLLQENQTCRSLKIWSAGCSTGEEPYSIAMVLNDAIQEVESWNISILATDIKSSVLDIAKQGKFDKHSIHAMPEYYLQKYFVPQGESWQISDVIRRMVEFRPHNLADSFHGEPKKQMFDLIFCRNVITYFDAETSKRVVSAFANCLKPGGFLFLGHAETLWGVSEEFRCVEFPQTFVYQKLTDELFDLKLPPPVELPKFNQTSTSVWPQPKIAVVRPELLNISGKSVDQLIANAHQLANDGVYREAVRLFDEVTARCPLNVEAHFVKGILFEKIGQTDSAIENFKRALYIDQGLVLAYYYLGNLYRFLERHDLARCEYQNCLKLLEGQKEDNPIPFSEDWTVEVLYQATKRALESVSADMRKRSLQLPPHSI